MKQYHNCKDGKRRKFSKIEVGLPEDSVLAIMDKLGIKQRAAEKELVSASLHIYGRMDVRLFLTYCLDSWILTHGHEQDMGEEYIMIESAAIFA